MKIQTCEENDLRKTQRPRKNVFEIKALENWKTETQKLTPMDESTSRVVSCQLSLQKLPAPIFPNYYLGKTKQYIGAIQYTFIWHIKKRKTRHASFSRPSVFTAKLAVQRLCEEGGHLQCNAYTAKLKMHFAPSFMPPSKMTECYFHGSLADSLDAFERGTPFSKSPRPRFRIFHSAMSW